MATQLIKGNNAISIDNYGWVLFKRPHGTFYSLADQAIANPAVNTQVITYSNSYDVEGLTLTDTSKIYVPTSGSYEVFFSGIANLASVPGAQYIEVWLKIDGSSQSDTNTRIQIKDASVEMTVAVAFIVDINAGQYIELGTWGSSTNCQWLHTHLTAASPARPDCPSVIVTVKKISSKLSYE